MESVACLTSLCRLGDLMSIYRMWGGEGGGGMNLNSTRIVCLWGFPFAGLLHRSIVIITYIGQNQKMLLFSSWAIFCLFLTKEVIKALVQYQVQRF